MIKCPFLDPNPDLQFQNQNPRGGGIALPRGYFPFYKPLTRGYILLFLLHKLLYAETSPPHSALKRRAHNSCCLSPPSALPGILYPTPWPLGNTPYQDRALPKITGSFPAATAAPAHTSGPRSAPPGDPLHSPSTEYTSCSARPCSAPAAPHTAL